MAGRVLIKSLVLKSGLLLLVLACFSCAGVQPRVQRLASLQEKEIKRAAVLPFLNSSDFNQGGTVVQRIFTSELDKTGGITVSREGDVRSIYRELHIFPYQMPGIEQRRILASRLRADILISGTVKEMEENSSGSFLNPFLALELQVYDGESGRTMWTTHYQKEGRDYRKVLHFGLINTVSGLSRRMSKEILKEWFPESRSKEDRE